MKLIDADKLKSQIAAAVREKTLDATETNAIYKLIDMQPEPKATPIPVGSDEIFTHWYECGKCGKENIMEGTSYCPDCGSRIIWQ